MRIGKATDSVLKRSVLKLIKDNSNMKSAAATPDCAYSIDGNGRVTLSAVSTYTAPYPVNAGYYAMYNAVNNIYVYGGVPRMAVVNIMLSPDTEESVLKTIVRDCRKAADEIGIVVSGGHTEVTDALVRPLISVYVTGDISEKYFVEYRDRRPAAGDAIIMTKFAGCEGTAILASAYFEELKNRLPEHMIKEAVDFSRYISIKEDAAIAIDQGGMCLHDISSGGVFSALWELADMAGCGIDVNLKDIPMRQEIVEVTNYLGKNPYQLMSGGSLLFISNDENRVLESLQEAGINADVIGRITDSNDRIIRNDEDIRFLDKPCADEILCGKIERN